jgi:rhodanese-related sulfurtransferase
MSEQIIAEISPLEAWKMLASDNNSVLIDVRSRVEFEYVGHPIGAINIPWQDAPASQVNPDFVDMVRASLQTDKTDAKKVEDLTLLLLCRSGSRSMAAAVELKKSGFRNLFNVAEGFEGKLDGDKHRGTINGWRFHKLPWQQG